MSSKTKVVITGSSGFIGQHLVKAFEWKSVEVIHIPHSLLSAGQGKIINFLEKHKPEIIIHLAAYGNHGQQNSNVQAVSANYINTWNLLEASLSIPYKAFINCSTSSIYGIQQQAMNEELTSVKPDTFYAASKAGAMYLARAYAKQYNRPVVSVIPFSVYGPGEADWRFIPTACKHIVDNSKMPFVGYPCHDWIYVDDLVSGIMTVLENVDKLKGEWVNIGTGESWTNVAILRMLQEITGKRLQRVETYKELPHHSKEWVSDNRKLLSLGWRPQVTLEEGLQKTWAFYKKKYESEKAKA